MIYLCVGYTPNNYLSEKIIHSSLYLQHACRHVKVVNQNFWYKWMKQKVVLQVSL